MNDAERGRFDRLLESVLAGLPPRLLALLDEAPLIVEDRPTPRMIRELNLDPTDEVLCGLHSGTPLTERSFGQGFDEPETIHLFREGIIEFSGGWMPVRDEDGTVGGEPAIREQIRITLLHEIGHHFGLEEEDLEGLGYG